MTLAETFDQLDWATIESYVELKQEEHLHLDFTTLKNAELTIRDDKLNIARCISGFANSSGGIIVWGIDARKNSDGIDCATKVVELRKPAVLVSRLNTLSGEATSPIIDGIRHKPIVNYKSGGGVVATFVPETDGGPFMALLGEQRYYKRSGDSFYQMEHFDLEDMFGRRQKPNLEMIIQPSKVEKLTRAVAREAVRAAELLLRMTPLPAGLPYLDGYRRLFMTRYGAEREVPILELLDPNFGLGPPSPQFHGGGYGGDPRKAAVRQQTLYDLAITALRERNLVVELDEKTLARLESWAPSPLTAPESLDL
jgi:hypothetical protein